MPRALLVASSDLRQELGTTQLLGGKVECALVSEPGVALGTALDGLPNLILIRDEQPDATLWLVGELRKRRETRRARVVVLTPSGGASNEPALRGAGADLVVPLPVDPLVWGDRLEEMLNEPRRRDGRIPVRFVVWPRPVQGPSEGSLLNLSVRGMLLQTAAVLPVGTTLELSFELPGLSRSTEVVGQVVRDAGGGEDGRLYGVDLIILRGEARERIAAFVAAEARR